MAKGQCITNPSDFGKNQMNSRTVNSVKFITSSSEQVQKAVDFSIFQIPSV